MNNATTLAWFLTLLGIAISQPAVHLVRLTSLLTMLTNGCF